MTSIIQVPREHFLGVYDNLQRWNSYWCQIQCIRDLNPRSILEVGIGNKTVATYLKLQGCDVTTLDINKKLEPVVVAEITSLPFTNGKFDAALCCEVLEHIHFGKVMTAVRELARVSKYIVISLPHSSIYLSLNMTVPLFKPLQLLLRLPLPQPHRFDGQHYWEIGKKGYSIKKIRNLFKNCGLTIVQEKTPQLNPHHHFFVLRKR